MLSHSLHCGKCTFSDEAAAGPRSEAVSIELLYIDILVAALKRWLSVLAMPHHWHALYHRRAYLTRMGRVFALQVNNAPPEQGLAMCRIGHAGAEADRVPGSGRHLAAG